MLPTKALNKEKPHLSWKQPSSLSLVEASLKELAELSDRIPKKRILLPIVVTGNGKLPVEDIEALIHKYLHNKPNVVLVYRN